MFKTAPRYLAGVSVFYGDDITRREVDGEIVFVLGQAQKGPRTPIALKTIDNSVPIYGMDSPLIKALYQFWDGYIDSPKAKNLRIVTLRVGGTQAVLTTPVGVTLTTVDAYNGIEDEYTVYINDALIAGARVIKAWDKNGQKILDTLAGIDSNFVTVTGSLSGTGQVIGKDYDSDPFDVMATFATAVRELPLLTTVLDTVSNTNISYNSTTDTTSIIFAGLVDADVNKAVTTGGWVSIAVRYGATTTSTNYKYTSAIATLSGGSAGSITLSISGSITFPVLLSTATASLSSFDLVQGDSQLTDNPRTKYELFRNALLEIEQFTPDYIVPGGIAFNEVDEYNKVFTYNTILTAGNITSATSTLLVDGASNWQSSGNVDIFNGLTTDQLVFNSKAVSGNNYQITLDFPTGLTITSNSASGTIIVPITGNAFNFAKLRQSGTVTIGGTSYAYTEVLQTSLTTATIAITGGLQAAVTTGNAVTKVPTTTGADWAGYTVSHSFTSLAARDLGVGYVKETDIGGSISFKWSDVKLAGYGLAHFGYLLANFCNDAAIGYNTPLAGMNVDITVPKLANFSRAALVAWVGSYPGYAPVPGMTDVVASITANGTGLLGNPVVAGSTIYNRTALNDVGNGIYVDPALGLMLTDEKFIDGHLIRDSFYKPVDLGKFMVCGAGLLTFNNRATVSPYVDGCGIYSLGLLAGKPDGQGISFSKIGLQSNVSVGVVVHRKYYNDLANLNYLVVTREKGLGWVINNGNSVSRNDSGYKLISTTKIIKTIIEGKRALLAGFINKPLNDYYYEAAKTRLADSFKKDVSNGLVNGYKFDLQVEDTGLAIGKLYLKVTINPPFEITQINIDTVIDRTIKTQG
jgi:hypothetical protein